MTAIALVSARFYDDIADDIEDAAETRIEERGVQHAGTVSVPGVYDAPLAADRLARRDDVDAVVVLGAVITGDTDHDEVVTHAAARQCSEVSLARDTPVTFGVSGPAMSEGQARDRVEYCAYAVDAAIDLAAELPARTE